MFNFHQSATYRRVTMIMYVIDGAFGTFELFRIIQFICKKLFLLWKVIFQPIQSQTAFSRKFSKSLWKFNMFC